MAGTFSAGHVQRVRSYRSHTKSRFDQRRWLSVPAMPQIVANKCEMALKMGGSLTVIGREDWGVGELGRAIAAWAVLVLRLGEEDGHH